MQIIAVHGYGTPSSWPILLSHHSGNGTRSYSAVALYGFIPEAVKVSSASYFAMGQFVVEISNSGVYEVNPEYFFEKTTLPVFRSRIARFTLALLTGYCPMNSMFVSNLIFSELRYLRT